MISWNVQPPLLQTYSAPSGPIAAPFGDSAGRGDLSTSCRRAAPGSTHPPPARRRSRCRRASRPGPSGNCSPVVISVISGWLMRAEHEPPRPRATRSRYGHAHSDGTARTSTCTRWRRRRTSTSRCTSTCTTRPSGSAASCASATAPTRATPSSRRASTCPTAASRSCTTGPKIANNDAFDAGGTRFEVDHAVRGAAHHLRRQARAAHRAAADGEPAPGVHREPVGRGARRADAPRRVADVRRRARERRRLTARPRITPAASRAATTSSTWRSTGTIRVGDDEWAVDGFGLRDHSWGPRFWQAPWWYRWLTANFGDDFGFVVSIIASRDGGRRYGGMVLRDGEYEHIRHATIETVWSGDDQYHAEVRATATTDDRHLRDHAAACSTSSRCATAARRPRASSSSRASPRA